MSFHGKNAIKFMEEYSLMIPEAKRETIEE